MTRPLRAILFICLLGLSLLMISSHPAQAQSTLQVKIAANGTENNQASQFAYQVANTGTSAVSGVSVRIYFTLDNGNAASNYTLEKYWDQSAIAAISGPTQASGSIYYYTVSYGTAALAAGSSWAFQGGLHLATWATTFDASNDWFHTGYAVGALPASYTTTNYIPGYVNSTLVWGSEPGGTSATVTKTNTSVPATLTNTANPPTLPPTSTVIAVTKTNTPVATNTFVPPTMTSLPTIAPTTGSSTLQVKIAANGNDNSQESQFAYQVANSAASAASGVSVRIYFTLDNGNAASNYALDSYYDQSGVASISGPTQASGSSYYYTVSYGTASLAAASSWTFQGALHLANWGTNFDASNDWFHTGYAVGALPASYTTTNYIPAYVNGSRVWGSEPGGTSQTSTPVAKTNTPTFVPPTKTNTPGSGPTSTPISATSTPILPTMTPSGPTATSGPGGKQVVGYYEQWAVYGIGYYVGDIVKSGSASKLTTINYAFGNLSPSTLTCYEITQTGAGDSYADYGMAMTAAQSVDGVADMAGQPIVGNFNQLRKLKAMYPNIKILLSIGGWTWSSLFSQAAATDASRANLAAGCIDLYIKGNLPVQNGYGGPGTGAGIFDGIDIDWEYPVCCGLSPNGSSAYSPNDTQDYTLMLAEFRKQLDAQGAIDHKHYMLTIAAPAGSDKYNNLQLSQLHQYIDYVNLMTYDFHGAWDTQGPTNFLAPLYPSPNDPSQGIQKHYNIDDAVNGYLAAGVPASKLVLGMPFYGRGWTNVPNVNNGLYQTSPNMQPPAPIAPSTEGGYENYNVLAGLSGYSVFRDTTTQSPWMYNGSTFWTFDDATSLGVKAAYIKSKGLAGAMIWPLDGDTKTGTLITSLSNGLK